MKSQNELTAKFHLHVSVKASREQFNAVYVWPRRSGFQPEACSVTVIVTLSFVCLRRWNSKLFSEATDKKFFSNLMWKTWLFLTSKSSRYGRSREEAASIPTLLTATLARPKPVSCSTCLYHRYVYYILYLYLWFILWMQQQGGPSLTAVEIS